jgi:hypothetical protein
MEEWKEIVGYEGYYEVSNMGQIRSMDRVVATTNKGGDCTKFLKGQIIKQCLNSNQNYWTVCLGKEGKLKTHRVNRLVGLAFILNPDNKPYVDHINRDKLDNKVSNLRWSTEAENNLNMRRGNTGKVHIYQVYDERHYKSPYKVKYTKNEKMTFKHFKTLEDALVFRSTIYGDLAEWDE